MQENEELYRLIWDNLTDLVAIIGVDGRRIYNSPSYRAVLGEPAELLGTDSFREIHPDDQARVQQVFAETVATGRGQRLEYRFVRRNGEVRFMESVGSVIRDAAGNVDRVVVVSRDVTERKRSEDAVRESEERYRRLLASTSDYNFSVTVQEGRAVATTHSPGCLSVTGYSADEFAADPQLWYRSIHEGDRTAVLEQVQRLLQGESPPPLEHRIVSKDGRIRWIRNTSVPRRNPQGRLVTYDGLVTDVTERRRAERLLEVQYGATGVLAEPVTLEAALNRVLRAVCLDLEWDLGAFWSAGNGAGTLRPQVTCVPAETGLEAAAAGCPDAAAAADVSHVGEAWRCLKPVWVRDLPSRLSPGRGGAAEGCRLRTGFAVPVISGGEAAGVIEFCSRQDREQEEDLLEMLTAVASQVGQFIQRNRLDQAARESQERLELVIRGSNDGVWDWDVRTNEVYFSARWKGMLGYAEAEVPNRFEEWQRLIHPDDRERAMRTVQDYFEGRAPVYELEHRLRHRDGSYRWILARGVVLRDPAGRPIRMAGSHVDLTDRKRAEEQLRASNDELERRGEELRHRVAELHAANDALRDAQLQLIQATKMEVVGTLAAGVAHEVRNPLQTLLMGLDFLDTSAAQHDPTTRVVMRDMREAVQRADKIVGGLLEFSAMNQPSRSRQDLNALVRQALHLAGFALSRSQVRVQEDLDGSLPAALVDANKIEQALINLIVNAVHAMADGGTLTVRSRCGPGAEAADGSGPPGVTIEIEDTGTGIPPHLMPRIFDPFFTTKPQGGGTGLGLSVTKRIIELHGGRIQIQNRAEGGVRVTIRLPCQPPASGDHGGADAATKPASTPGDKPGAGTGDGT